MLNDTVFYGIRRATPNIEAGTWLAHAQNHACVNAPRHEPRNLNQISVHAEAYLPSCWRGLVVVEAKHKSLTFCFGFAF
jgi:hypothetical protein